MEPIDRLRKLIREDLDDGDPFFTDEDLDFYLGENGGSVEAAAYQLLILKSEDNSLEVSGMSTKDTSRYFLRLAQQYRQNNSGGLWGA